MSPILEYLLAVRRHWAALVTGSLPIAVYTILALGFPDEPHKIQHFWNHLPQWAVILLALLGVTVAQFLAWNDLRTDRENLKGQLRERRQHDRQTAIMADLDMRFGPSSPGSQARLESAIALFEKLEAEILAGNFSNADELLIFRDFFTAILRSWFASGGAYPHWQSRLLKVVSAVVQHERELTDNEP
ncbi:MAG TPA: hypothetical protein VF173_34650 [Thermoanaerobaculia bacterium]|nr:hypothetical protein [Thermoanaerobaculia bacterium]